MKKTISLMLCLVLAATLLCACDEKAQPVQTTAAPTTQATEAPTTEATEAPTQPQLLTEEAVQEALDTTSVARLNGDIELTKQIVVMNGLLDGNGFKVTGPTYVENDPETENAITVMGGTVQNISVSGAYRGIGDSSSFRVTNDVRLNSVYVDSQTYTLNFGYGNGTANLYVENSILKGWTSYTKFGEAIFTNCTFGWDTQGQNGNLRPYINTTLIGCHFEGLEAEDGTVTPFGIRFKQGSDGIQLVLEDCYVGDTLITEENVSDLLGLDLQGNQLMVRNTN